MIPETTEGAPREPTMILSMQRWHAKWPLKDAATLKKGAEDRQHLHLHQITTILGNLQSNGNRRAIEYWRTKC